MNKNGVKEFFEAAGAIAELTRVMYDSYIRVGFEREQAADFTKHMVATQLQIAALTHEKE